MHLQMRLLQEVILQWPTQTKSNALYYHLNKQQHDISLLDKSQINVTCLFQCSKRCY